MRNLPFLWLVSSLVLFASLASAWPWPELFDPVVVRRQDRSSSASSDPSSSATPSTTGSSSSGTITAKPSASSGSDSSSSGSDSSSGSGSDSATSSDKDSSETTADSSSGSGSKTTKEPAKTTAVDPRLPAGGIQMVTPAVTAGPQYYRAGTNITFGWNYTSLSVTPTAIDILASCSANNHYYTIATNQSVEESGSVTWDTNAEKTASVQLLTETYTLVIHDAAMDVSATAQAGFLGTYSQFTFGIYQPSPYADLDSFKCATCSGGMSDMDRQALRFVFGMAVVTVLSFSWFVGGLGLF
ncbi:MAG: hypothetical protein M1832_003572 [Thelocarpon impressellum]|nr:MAG: hypothetical protein M1832_003572 [Thelocarpon impressellum]